MSELKYKTDAVEELKYFLSFLPLQLRQEYGGTIKEQFPNLCQEEKISDIFINLSPLVSYIDYGLTKYIINELGSNSLKKEMKEYSEDMEEFMKKTTIKNLMDNWPESQKIPQGYSTLKATIDENPQTYTLYEVDQFRIRYCRELKLDELVVKTVGLKMANSFIIEWLVPSVLVSSLLQSARQLDFGFYDREHILKVEVGGEQIFPFLPDSKTKVPTVSIYRF